MDVFMILGIAIIGTILSIILKQSRPEISIIISILTIIIIVFNTLGSQNTIFSELKILLDKTSISHNYFLIVLKTIGICFLTQLVCNICKDAGQNAIAVKVDFAGRIAICLSAMPLYKELIHNIEKILGKVT